MPEGIPAKIQDRSSALQGADDHPSTNRHETVNLLYISIAFTVEYWYKFQHFTMDYSSLSCDELFRACVDPGNIEAWQEFVRRFNPLIKVTVWRVSCRYGVSNGPLIEDLIQDTFTKVCHNNFHLLRTFKSDHPNACFGMIKIIARNAAIDHFRKPDPIPIDDLSEDEISNSQSHATPGDELERQIVRERIEKIVRIFGKYNCSQRDQEIFWLYYLYEFSAREIAALSKFKELSTKGVESVLHRLKRLIQEN